MSVETTAAPQRATKPRPLPATHPRLPIVQFRSEEKPPFELHYSAIAAAQAAFDHPRDDFVDLRGAAARLVTEDDGSSRLVAAEKGDQARLRERLLAALRDLARGAGGGEPIPADVKALLDWLAAAPGVEYLVHGLGLAPTDDPLVFGRPCKKCTWMQHHFPQNPPCCPG